MAPEVLEPGPATDQALAYLLGNIALGNLGEYLPFILHEIGTQPRRQYLLLHRSGTGSYLYFLHAILLYLYLLPMSPVQPEGGDKCAVDVPERCGQPLQLRAQHLGPALPPHGVHRGGHQVTNTVLKTQKYNLLPGTWWPSASASCA